MTVGVKRKRNEEIDSESDEEYQNEVDNEMENETAHEARVRMKKDMIKKLKAELKSRKVENEDKVIQEMMEEEAIEKQGKVLKDESKACSAPENFKRLYKCHHDITCMVFSEDGKFIFTGTSTGDVGKWNFLTGEFMTKVKGGKRRSDHKYHKSRVSAIAANNEYVATGDLEKKIFIWDFNLEMKKILLKHRDEITSLVFRRNTTQLFSGDKKGIIFVWDMILMDSIEELLGHTSKIEDLDSNLANHCLSCSGISDPCLKLWKLEKDSMITYSLPKKSHDLTIECVSMMNERYFVAGSLSNKIYLWDGISKKTPMDVVQKAHSMPKNETLRVTTDVYPVSICALKHTTIFASGSNMSEVKVWCLRMENSDNFVIQMLFVLPNIIGCINGLKFSPDGKDLVVAMSNQHKRHSLQKKCPGLRSMMHVYKLFQ